MIFVSATPSVYENEHQAQVAEQVVRPTGLVDPTLEVRPAGSQVDDCLSEIHAVVEENERVLITVLTKRMAEDLTDYLMDHGIRVRYLHSDIDTVERVEIIRDLRKGEFDVLVGINLLREGLDMPEVSLVAIMDADKEGFLRSDRSLIQTIGRAARNVNGRAILYADKVTDSMQRAMDETERRRNKQISFNSEHGIVPKTIKKRIDDVMEGAHRDAPGSRTRKAKEKVSRATTSALMPENPQTLTPQQLAKEITRLEDEMFKAAKSLEFERAAAIRDSLAELQSLAFK